MTRYVVILGSLDTKGLEVAFLRDRVRAEGATPLVVDTGVLAEATVPADITRQEVARAAGCTIESLIERGDKTHALLTMAHGTTSILQVLLREGQLGGVLSIGGSRGTGLSTQVMQSLPVGVPKVMVSTMASGKTPFGPYVGTKDVTLMHSVSDVQGVNPVTRRIFANAAAAIAAMSRVGGPVERGEKQILAASMLGVSTTLVSQIQALMGHESEVIPFHSVGTGGRAMEELIDSGLVEGVFDVSPGEMTALVVGGPYSAGAERMRAAGRQGIPQVVAPGGLDFIIEGPLEDLPAAVQARYRGRKIMSHTPTINLVRTSCEEMEQVARLIAERLDASTGPAAMILPLRAFGWFACDGQPLCDPESDRAFIDTFKAHAPAEVKVVEMDTHLNDPAVGEAAVELMKEMLAG